MAPELIQTYRELFWAVAAAADREVSGEAMKHVHRLRDLVANVHPSVEAIGLPLDRDPRDIVATEAELTLGLAEWVSQLLEHLEIVAPGIAPGVLKEATGCAAGALATPRGTPRPRSGGRPDPA